MTREEFIRKLQGLSKEEYDRVAPFLETDLESVEELEAIYREIASGRRSADLEPILESRDVYRRVREALSK